MQNEIPPRIAYRYAEVAQRLGVHRDTVRHWAKAGKIRAVVVSGTPLIPAAELDRLMQVVDDRSGPPSAPEEPPQSGPLDAA